jgi:cardiolipin synthase
MKKKTRMTLANQITIARIVLIPVFVIGLLQRAVVWPLLIFLFSAATDVLDGFIARRRGERTVLGSFLDPVADKLLLVSSFLTLAHLGLVPMWVFVVVFSRDFLILVGWNIIYILTQNARLTPRWPGKSTTFLQMLSVILLLVLPGSASAHAVVWLMVAATAVSTVDYVWVGAKRLSELG